MRRSTVRMQAIFHVVCGGLWVLIHKLDAWRGCAVVYEMSQLLNTGLDRQSVQLLMALCEHGVNPEALAAVVRELRREAAAISAGAAAADEASADGTAVAPGARAMVPRDVSAGRGGGGSSDVGAAVAAGSKHAR